MRSEKVTFENKKKEKIAAIIDWPLHQKPKATALFAHCFTCTKNLTAVKNISKGLTSSGFAVLRFDFTGLGESEGEFEETNFETNIDDLELAANFLAEKIEAPKLLIGHSLGGTAILHAANKIKSAKGIVTIGSPYQPSHAAHLFEESVEEIKEKGRANVTIGGRPFTVNAELLKSLNSNDSEKIIAELDRALLVLHSPQDRIVGIENAEKIYKAAKHPKSFISMDGADHLLSEKLDSMYVGDIISSWLNRYLIIQEDDLLSTKHQAAAQTNADSLTTEVIADGHPLIADEPKNLGGNDLGASPYGLLSAALASCTSLTLQLYAQRKKWDLKVATVHVNHCKIDDEESSRKIDYFVRTIDLKGDLNEDQRSRLLEIANKCPVHKTLHAASKVDSELME
jgi:putative redox protein